MSSDERSYEERVYEYSVYWGIANWPGLASQWYDRCFGSSSVYCTALVFPMKINGRDCIIVACSTAETNRIQADHAARTGQILRDLAWMYLECYQFLDLALNFQGMSDPRYAASSFPIGTLQELLDGNAVL